MRAIANLPDKIRKTVLQKKKELDSHGTISRETIKGIEEEMQIEYVYNSNKIEGNELSRGETALVLRGTTVNHKSLQLIRSARDQKKKNGSDRPLQKADRRGMREPKDTL